MDGYGIGGCARVLLGVLGIAASTAGAAMAAESCANDYYAALAQVRTGKARDLATIANQVRAPEPGFGGRWLLPQQTRPGRAAAEPERQCAESVLRNGRQRCIRWEAKAPARAIVQSLAPTREEIALAKFVEDAVAARGALAEFGTNGRYYFIFNRVTAELNGYVTQPLNPALCSGAPQFLDFLLEQIAPVRKRLDDVIAADKAAREVADRRVAATGRLAREPVVPAEATPAAAGEASPPQTPQPPVAAAQPAPPLTETPRARRVDYSTLLAEVGGLFGQAALSPAAATKQEPGLVHLQRVRALVTAAPTDPSRPQLKEHALAALRSIEVGLYGEQIRRRFGLIERAVYGAADDIRAAHTTKCTCSD